MKMFKFFKGKGSFESEAKVEEVSFGDIGKWIEVRGNDLGKHEEGIFVDIARRFEDFYISLGGKLEVLKEIDVESKNEHGRVKVLVRQGLDKYINFVDILLKGMRGIRLYDLDKVIREISDVFIGFERDSAKGYERATYLIGDEMGAVRNEIRGFYNGLVKTFEVDDSSIRDLGRIRDVRLKLDEFENVGKNVEGIKKEIKENGDDIRKAEERVKELKSEAEEIGLSSEYVANLKKGEDIVALRKRIEREVFLLKGLVDFKKIVGIVHGNEKEFGLIKNYRDHFALEFSRDDGKRLRDLLESLNMKSSAIREKFVLIKEKSSELGRKVGEVGEDVVAVKLGEAEKVEGGIEGMKDERAKVERRLGEVELRLKGLRDEVVLLVEKVGGVRVVG